MLGLSLIEAVINLSTGVAKIITIKEARKYQDRLIQIKLEIMNEKQKGDMQDDAKIELLHMETEFIINAITQDINNNFIPPKSTN